MTTEAIPYDRTKEIYDTLSSLTTLEQARKAQSTCIGVLDEIEKETTFPSHGTFSASEEHLAKVYGVALAIFIQQEQFTDCNRALREFSHYIEKRDERPGFLAGYTNTLASAYLDRNERLQAVSVLTTYPHRSLTATVKVVAQACLLHGELNAADQLLRHYPIHLDATRNELAHQFLSTGKTDDATRLLASRNVEHSSDIWERIVQAHIANDNITLAEKAAIKSEKDDLILLVCKAYIEKGLPLEARTLATTSQLKKNVDLVTEQLSSLSL